MLALSDAFDLAMQDYVIPKTSGLIIRQKWFSLFRKNASAD
jgi:hypothetical protein